MIIAIAIVYGVPFLGLGILFMIVQGKVPENQSGRLYKARVVYDDRVKRHREDGGYYQ
jgi:hypothetical protein